MRYVEAVNGVTRCLNGLAFAIGPVYSLRISSEKSICDNFLFQKSRVRDKQRSLAVKYPIVYKN